MIKYLVVVSVCVLATRCGKSDESLAKAFSEAGQEIGRSAVDVEFAADDAKYVTFKFDKHMDSRLVHKYVIDIREPDGVADH